MALLDILHYPDPRLQHRSRTVETVNTEIKALVEDMLETMYAANGIGLAAVQVNRPLRIVVVDISLEKTNPLCLINPHIETFGELLKTQEGCLSVPGIFETVDRPNQIKVDALDRDGNPVSFTTDGVLAVCIQHEVDHLNGTLFIDHLSRLKRQRIQKKVQKSQRVSA